MSHNGEESVPSASLEGPAPMRLGEGAFEERLLAELQSVGAMDAERADRARRAHERAGGSLIEILIRLGLCEERPLAEAAARVAGCSLLTSEDMPTQALRKEALSAPFLREHRIVPIKEEEAYLVAGVADPSSATAEKALRLVFGKDVRFIVAPASQIEDAVLRLYTESANGPAETQFESTGDITDSDVARLRESASEAPIVRFVDRLIARAIEDGASDIHIEPLERHLRVRLRIDGILAADDPVSIGSAPAIVSRIKILARLDIAERRLPQDGAFKMNVRGREVDLRVATAPVTHGEAVVIRILDRESVRLDLRELGFDENHLDGLARALGKPNGIMLVTGPTGSGKSTTLYAALDRLNTEGRKIVTVEDPVEYRIDGLNQIQVKPEIGLDFARTLRSVLRHDPDVIMVGEIRDAETARMAIQAALTGHLVLSTLHTNDAVSAVTRLLDMGIEDYLITSTLACVVAQRLVRTLCQACRRPVEVPAALKQEALLRAAAGVFESRGCQECRGTGYRGRAIVAEMFTIGANTRAIVLSHPEASQLQTAAVQSGMQSLYQNGLDAVFAGRTTYAEILRVAQDLA